MPGIQSDPTNNSYSYYCRQRCGRCPRILPRSTGLGAHSPWASAHATPPCAPGSQNMPSPADGGLSGHAGSLPRKLHQRPPLTLSLCSLIALWNWPAPLPQPPLLLRPASPGRLCQRPCPQKFFVPHCQSVSNSRAKTRLLLPLRPQHLARDLARNGTKQTFAQ